MNEKEICFIICVNNKLYAEECIYYINHLNVPDGYQIDVLTVEEAESMTAGYNEAMRCSKAKYKVYLHQDVFIVNSDFIQDFLNVFHSDKEIGMIGMIGGVRFPDNGIMWEGERCGAVYSWNIWLTELCRSDRNELTEVEVIDGLLMITQYDLPWREDLFDKWDFYDCSQSREFIRHGYKVVVPEMEKPWCLHDCGVTNFENYEKERLKFLEEYHYKQSAPDDLKTKTAVDNKYGVTLVLTTHNQKNTLIDTVKWLENIDGVSDIIIVDNGSADGTAEWLSAQNFDYIWFDEGVQGYGKLWNTVLSNFETADLVAFLEAGVYPDKESLICLAKALELENVGIASPVSENFFRYLNAEKKENCKMLLANWEMWMIKKNVLERNGAFCEEIKKPENVLRDYELRLIKNGLCQMICPKAEVHTKLSSFYDRYAGYQGWDNEDRNALKTIWKMNYFNLSPNFNLIEEIREEKEQKFDVLEIGCDLGATLFAIQDKYPNCRISGLDINEAAVDVAKHVADVRCGNIDELQVPFSGKFDYIIFGDVLEHLRHPEEVVGMCREILNDNGCIIASIPNIMHISVLEGLIDGRFSYQDTGLLDRTHIHFFTYYEILKMFQEAGYAVESIEGVQPQISSRQKEIENVLISLSDSTEPWMYEVFQYVVKARKI